MTSLTCRGAFVYIILYKVKQGYKQNNYYFVYSFDEHGVLKLSLNQKYQPDQKLIVSFRDKLHYNLPLYNA